LLGDRLGRKTVLFLGEALFAVGVLTFGFSTEFWQFIASNIVWALGVCFIVAGDTPFVYDTLVEFGRQTEFINVMAIAGVVMYAMNSAACVVGGVIAEYTGQLELTLIVSALVALGGSLTVLTLKEPRVDRDSTETFRAHLGAGVRRVLSSRAIVLLIAFQIVLEVGIYVMGVFRGIYMDEDLNLGYLQIGLFFSTFLAVAGLTALRVGKIEARLGEKMSLLVMYLVVFASFIVVFAVDSPIAISTQYLIYMVAAMQGPIIMGYINKRVDSAHRSTVVALATFLFTIVLVVAELASGWLASAWSLKESLLVLALATAPIAAYLLIQWNREVDASVLGSAKAGILRKS
jgi:MFS family permease